MNKQKALEKYIQKLQQEHEVSAAEQIRQANSELQLAIGKAFIALTEVVGGATPEEREQIKKTIELGETLTHGARCFLRVKL